MPVLSVLAGVTLVVIALNDVFHTLLRPTATGRLSAFVFRGVWAVTRTRRRTTSGPLTILATVTVWLVLITVGWALIYLPWMPDGFSYSGVDPQNYSPFAEAIGFSLVALTTLGLGDVVPAAPLLRLLTPLEALTGFALLSAAVAWFMQLYPALSRRRAFAIELTSLHEAGLTTGLGELSDERAASVVRSVSRSLAEVTADLVQNTEIFYFTEKDETLSAPRALHFALELRDAALASRSVDVRAEGRVLARGIDELSRVLRTQYPHLGGGESADDVFGNAARGHGHGPPEEPTAE
ncbi:potassium channel family protein [Microbacterium sp. CFBP9034]|uniref:potassium channel family protein n=1 Tax=Microbacterium sp. CFBP9034 TaxID=3096540 RepID=UPI002A69E2BB|nr:potassium channel family protein [Microbacterium sp. CFBP9034]MDY0908167.1 potassium channel family protein [Microbacterium sp. CFBP9034]